MAEDRNIYKIHDNGSLGEVQIADEVVAIIAGLAATEVEGVGSMAGNITNELVGKTGNEKPFQRGKGRYFRKHCLRGFGFKYRVWIQYFRDK